MGKDQDAPSRVRRVMFSLLYSQLIGTARAACEECASRCEEALAESVRPGTDPYTEHQIALLTCASVCRLTASELFGRGRDLREMVSWCRDVCKACADMQDMRHPKWASVLVGCLSCADACGAVARAAKSEEQDDACQGWPESGAYDPSGFFR